MTGGKVGELRPSQMLYNFGVGGVVDLPQLSVMILGLDEWETAQMRPLSEERLLAAVRRWLGQQVNRLAEAPLSRDAAGAVNPWDDAARIGIPVAPFPGWAICPVCKRLAPLDGGSFELQNKSRRWQDVHFSHQTCNAQNNSRRKRPVIPARFVVACADGHLDEFPWVYFVHNGETACKAILQLSEYGASGAAADIWIKCLTCSKRRNMSEAFGESAKRTMPMCRGRHPHLNKFEGTGCDQQMKTMLLGASNLWFPVTLSALTIPTKGTQLAELVDKHWSYLNQASSRDLLQFTVTMLQSNGQLTDLRKYSIDDLWPLVEAKRAGQVAEEEKTDMKEPEWLVFSQPDPARNSADFELTVAAPPTGFENYFEKVVLLHRLREVTALLGFTRIESPADYRETGEEVPMAPIARQSTTWVPAIEVRGEGIFLQFKEEALRAWEESALQREYQRKTADAHINWRTQRNLDPKIGMPNARQMLMHSFAHALMQQFAIECGYNVASLRERIYSRLPGEEGGPMAGVLIYTAAPDSEGTLGGLVALGRPEVLGRHIEQALERVQLCAGDPLCAEHDPLQATGALHWAACHSCLFSPETSCEKGNKYLDRALLVTTIKSGDRAYFSVQ